MHRSLPIMVAVLSVSALQGQSVKPPLTHVEACRSFADAFVQVDTDTMHGTGFVADPDGWILTALHVVADPETLVTYGNLSVSMLGQPRAVPAELISPVNRITSSRDLAILKIDKTRLPNLELGDEGSIENGSPVSVIGLPLAAMFGRFPPSRVPQFYLTGTIAAQSAFPFGGRTLFTPFTSRVYR
jgi:S1-C subfamily serine protease